MTDEAYTRPSDRWSTAANDLLSQPYKQKFLDSVATLRDAGLHAIGHLLATGRVTNMGASQATIEACLNTSARDIVDIAGNSVSAGNSTESLWKYLSIAEMELVDGNWKLVDSVEYRDRPC